MANETTINIKLFVSAMIVYISTLVNYLGIDKEAITILSVFLLLDFLTGVGKAKRLDISITSNKMKYGIVSKLIVIMIPFLLSLTAKAVNIDLTNLVFVCVDMLVLSELYSIISNIYTIKTAKELPEYEVISVIGKKIRNVLLAMEGTK